MAGLQLASVHLAEASQADQARGLLGYCSCVVGGQLRLEGITLRRTRTGEYALSFPERTDATGRRHALMCPVNPAARQAIEGQILGALHLDGPDGREGAA